MKKVLIAVVAVLVIGGVVLAFVHANSGSSKSNDNMAGMDMSNPSANNDKASSSTQPVATNTVSIKNFAFSPQNITVPVGTTVHWTNNDSAPHTVTSDDAGSDGPNSQQLGPGDTYEFTFKAAGTYKYHCTVHPNMTATVVVK